MEKKILSAQELLLDSFRLGGMVLRDDFRPTMIVAIWRGGTPVGMAVQELMSYCGVDADHIAIRTSSYSGTKRHKGEVVVHGLNYIVNKICSDDSVLIVDDVFDTGNTIVAVINQLRKLARKNMPDNVSVAVPWYKPSRNQTDMVPDYYVHSTDEWLVFPHELDSMTTPEFKAHRPQLYNVMHPDTADPGNS